MTDPVSFWLLQEGVKLVSRTVSAVLSFTLQADTSYGVEVRVVTRLGDVPVQGVKVKIKAGETEEEFGTSGATGQILDGSAPKRRSVTGKALTVSGSYKNTAEKLREERFTVALTEIDPGNKAQKVKVTHEIPRIRDAAGEADDADFKTEYETAGDLEWKDDGGARVLAITIRLCTFSLKVPYVNQRASNDTVSTRPGLAAGKDPEALAHAVRGPASDGKFSGGVLCYPSSVKMVLEYWGVVKARADIMQACYDQWAGEKFPDRLDKKASTTSSDTAPASPAQGAYWLDTSADTGAGYTMKRARYEISWETLTGTPAATYTQTTEPEAPTEGQIWKNKTTGVRKRAWYVLDWSPLEGSDHQAQHEQAAAPARAKDGEIWKDTSSSPAVFKVGKKRFKEWKAVPEADWRTDVWGGSTVWEYGWREVAAMKSFKPAGTTATSAHSPVADATVFPLSKPAATETDVTADILAKYKEWLGHGWPFVIGTTATAGHMMAARGAVLNKDGEVEWLIVNDPYGNLEGTGASYQSDEQNAQSATGAGSDKGKHAYYRNATLGKDSNLRIKGQGRGFPRIEKALTATELAGKLVPGAEG